MLAIVIGIRRASGSKEEGSSPLQERVRGPGMVLRAFKGVWFIHSTVIEHFCEDTVLGNGKVPCR